MSESVTGCRMSFNKALQLIHLAQMAAARHGGISLEDIEDACGCSHRTAQRLTDALEDWFPDIVVMEDHKKRRRWKLQTDRQEVPHIRDGEALEALDMAIKDARHADRRTYERALVRVRDRMLFEMPSSRARRLEVDSDAVMSSVAEVSRPRPQASVDMTVAAAIRAALRGPFRLRIRCTPDETEDRVVEPLGVLAGQRYYIVALEADGDGSLHHLRLDQISEAEVLEANFVPPADFDLHDHAARAFSAFHDPSEYGEVIWHFDAEASQAAAAYLFHPTQRLERQPDGSLVVRFRASGWQDMAWFLYQWGDHVDVISPEGLRKMVTNYRRSDFSTLP